MWVPGGVHQQPWPVLRGCAMGSSLWDPPTYYKIIGGLEIAGIPEIPEHVIAGPV